MAKARNVFAKIEREPPVFMAFLIIVVPSASFEDDRHSEFAKHQMAVLHADLDVFTK